MSPRARLLLAFLPGLVAVPVLIAYGPIAQDPCYHRFADTRTVWGIPHFGDIVTNLPFVIVGLLGLLRRPPLDWSVFFAGVGLTGIGSAYYHLDPTDATLVWDRLPMTLGFMGFFAAFIRERVDAEWGQRLLWPLVLVGLASIVVWARTGDLRLYALVQFYPPLAIVLVLLLSPGADKYYWLALAFYGAAKLTEALDHQIWSTNGVVSGHNAKHVFAALGAWWIVVMLDRRRPGTSASRPV